MEIKQIFKKGQKFAGSKGLVFIDDSYVLVPQRDGGTDFYPNYDDLPGGCQEPRETPFETFQRELMEEMGVHVVPEEISYAVSRPDIDNESEELFFMVANLHHDTRKQIKFGDEGKGYLVIQLDQLLTDRQFIPGYKDLVKEYLEYAENHRHPLHNKRGHLADHLALA